MLHRLALLPLVALAEQETTIQGTSYAPVYYRQNTEVFTTTLDPYNLNMYLDYGHMNIFNDDRSIPENERGTFTGWYFRPRIDGATISLYEGDVIVMYVQIENPKTPGEFESWSCSTTYQMRSTVYVGQVNNYEYGQTLLTNDAVERDSYTPAEQTLEHPMYMRNGPWMAANALEWYL